MFPHGSRCCTTFPVVVHDCMRWEDPLVLVGGSGLSCCMVDEPERAGERAVVAVEVVVVAVAGLETGG